MSKNIKLEHRALKFGWLILLLLLLGATAVQADERAETLVLGTMGSNPNKKSGSLQPMVDYAAGKMADVGIRKGTILIAKTHDELIHAIKEGTVDWITGTPFSILQIIEQTGAEIMARRWKSSMSQYASLFFVPNESTIHSLEELRGKAVAFGDRDSTTAYSVPLAVLREKGLSPTEIASPRDAPLANKVSYILAGEEANIFYWVRRKLVAAGVASTADWEESLKKQNDFKDDFRIIHQTKPFPRAVELVRKGLDPAVKTRLREVLFGACNDPHAQDALKSYNHTKKFDAMEGDALVGMKNAQEILQHIRDLL